MISYELIATFDRDEARNLKLKANVEADSMENACALLEHRIKTVDYPGATNVTAKPDFD